jgi:hypothetical protein
MLLPLPLIFLVYAVYLTFTGRPLFWTRARPIATRPVVIESVWCQVAGGVYILRFLTDWLIPSLPPEIDLLLMVVGSVLLLIGIIDSLRKKTEVL